MIIAVDFDRTVVKDSPYDITTPLELLDGAREGLLALRAVQTNLLVLWSARASRALLFNPELDPLVRVGARRANVARWLKERPLHLARYRQMLSFVEQELPDVFHAIDDGAAGKFEFDLVIDDKAVRVGFGMAKQDWADIARQYGAY